MGVIPCHCLRNSAVHTIQIMDPPQGDLRPSPSMVLFVKTGAQFSGSSPAPNLRDTAQTVRVFKWQDEGSSLQEETSFYQQLPLDQSFLAVGSLPNQKNHHFQTGEIVSREEVLMKINDGVVRILQRELPDCPLLVDYEGRWIERRSGTCVFQYHYTVKPYLPIDPESTNRRISRKPWCTPTYCLPDGRVYYGEVIKNRPHGVGILITAHPESLFKGDFDEGIPHGIGVLETQIFTVEGYWEKGWFVKGFVKYLTDCQYVGNLVEGRPEGIGNFKDLINNITYNGQFKQGYYEGEGIYFSNRYAYKGGFQKGKKQGPGSIQYFPTKDQPTRIIRGVWNKDALPH